MNHLSDCRETTTTTSQPAEITIGTSYQDIPMEVLREGIRKENTKARSLARKSLEHVRTCGEMLIALKSKVGHGNWNFEIKLLNMSQKTASNYMRIASNWQRVADMDHGVKDALALLCREDSPPPSPRSSPRQSPAPIATHADSKVIEPRPFADRIMIVVPSVPSPRPSPVPVIIEAEIVADVVAPSPPSAPAPNDAFLTIMELLPELDQSELHNVVKAIESRWIRGGKEGK
jgi:hypothetical protein